MQQTVGTSFLSLALDRYNLALSGKNSTDGINSEKDRLSVKHYRFLCQILCLGKPSVILSQIFLRFQISHQKSVLMMLN
jgi:hypothetical protein